MTLATALQYITPALIGAILGSVITLLVASKRFVIENVTAERQKWRDDIRKLSSKIATEIANGKADKLRCLRAELRTKLNPLDADDILIIECVHEWPPHCRERISERFAILVSLLLKHDWERAKKEAAFFSMPLCPPVRHTLSQLAKRNLHYKKFEFFCKDCECDG